MDYDDIEIKMHEIEEEMEEEEMKRIRRDEPYRLSENNELLETDYID